MRLVRSRTRLPVVAACMLPLLLGTCKSESQPPAVPVPAQLVKVAGDEQAATVGQVLAQPIVMQVNDAAGHALAGVSVTFAAAAGSGSVGTAAATTNASGQAQTTWTLGQTAGSQTVRATVGTLPVLSFVATAAAGPAASMAAQAGDGQTTVTGHPVTVPPTVIVRDAFNNPKPGVAVTFAAAAGNGSVTGANQTTGANGIATVGSWTLDHLGTDSLTATAAGSGISGNPVVFTATSGPSVAANVAVYVGNNQKGLVGNRVNVRPAVRVTDAASGPVAGIAVTFAVASGAGSLTVAATVTNSTGIAQVGSWTLGVAPGTNTVTATVTGAGIGGNPVTFADTGKAQAFTIDLQYFGPTPTPVQAAAFTTAISKWQSIIYQHVGPPIMVSSSPGQCGVGEPPVNQTVNDLLILATLDSIDGPNGILGVAGPCFVRLSPYPTLSIVGVMVFDTADVAGLITAGRWNDVILHEMGHVLGLGTLWEAPANCLLLKSTPPGTIEDTYFGCAKGRAAFDSIGGTNYTGGMKVPVENCGTAPYVYPNCGSGTVNAHWREGVFVNELMTGFINAGTNPLSVFSIAAQEDLGYTVNYGAADIYTHVFMAPPMGGAPPVSLGDDIRHGPIYVVDAAGTVVRVIHIP